MSSLPDSLSSNLKFLAAEVDSELKLLHRCFGKPSASATRRVLARTGYAANLRLHIQSASVEQFSRGSDDENQQRLIEALGIIGNQLERMTEKCRDCARSIERIDDYAAVELKDLRPLVKRISTGVADVVPALLEHDSKRALALGQLVDKIERSCDRHADTYLTSIRKSRHAPDIAQALFIVQALRQMGDALLRCAEAVISGNLGQAISFERYQSLQRMSAQIPGKGAALNMETLAYTRSGSTIAAVARRKTPSGYAAVYKDGERGKLKEERQGVESWHELYPGLAPKILDYRKRGESAALLIEHLPGMTFEQVLLAKDPELLDSALKVLGKTLRSVWRETRSDERVPAGFMEQLQKRLPEVYRVHPEFRGGTARIGSLRIASLETEIRKAQSLERKLKAPFSVYIHGDFNVDNIIFDPLERRINFIDLHRSRYMDYVQDVSVFMVSIYRLQIFDTPTRARMLQTALDFHRIAAEFAKRQKDASFEQRLALGLARSFCTSTRFILDKTLSRRMLLRARYLLQIFCTQAQEEGRNFRVPLKELFLE